MISNWVWFTILLATALYLFILLAIVVGRLGYRRGLSGGAEQKTRWLKSFGSKLEDCWTCVSKFWFQVEPHEPSESKEPTPPESSARPQPGPTGLSCPLQRGKLVSKFCEIIPSTPTALEAALEKVMAVVKTLPCAPDEIENVELALNEALANAVLHGNRTDPAKKVIVACFCESEPDGGLLLVVRDEGSGFDPSEVPDPTTAERLNSTHGRGIFLMRQLMDEVSYRDRGSEIELRKRRKR